MAEKKKSAEEVAPAPAKKQGSKSGNVVLCVTASTRVGYIRCGHRFGPEPTYVEASKEQASELERKPSLIAVRRVSAAPDGESVITLKP